MPDVFKVLKDVELKAVGLDPETNALPSHRNGGLLTAGQLRLNNQDAVRPSASKVSDA